MTRLAGAILLALALAGCDPRECWLGISHGDCGAGIDALGRGQSAEAFPQDDAICRDYGLTPGTYDYAVCRAKKAHVRALTGQETDRGVLQGPFLPSPR